MPPLSLFRWIGFHHKGLPSSSWIAQDPEVGHQSDLPDIDFALPEVGQDAHTCRAELELVVD